MKLYKSKAIYQPEGYVDGYLVVEGEQVVGVAKSSENIAISKATELVDFGEHYIFPGIVDCHVHINEPGRTDWEGFATATSAAAAGGITTVVDMPLNCIPVTTSADAMHTKLSAVDGKLFVDCGFWGGVTADSLQELPGLLKSGVLGVKSFLIDSGIEEFKQIDFEQAEVAMKELQAAGLPYLFHAEWDQGTAPPATDQSYQSFLASRPNDWEDSAIARLIELCDKTKCAVHIVHLSSASALPLIAAAKARGLPFTVETCPHYLLFAAEDIDKETKERRPLYKCCPPIRERANADLLWQGLQNGVIDMIVSDHSPCTAGLKKLDSGDLQGAWGGIMGLQSGFVAVYAAAVARNFPLQSLIPLMTERPAALTQLQGKGRLAPGYDADFFVFDPKGKTVYDVTTLMQKNKVSPYTGRDYPGAIHSTYLRGELIYDGSSCPSHARGRPLVR